MQFVLSGGGTAGHINPALALAQELQDLGHTIFFAGTPNGVEARLVPEAGIPFVSFEAAGFNRRHPLSIIKASQLILSSSKKAREWFREIEPDCVVSFGGYVSIPVARAARMQNIPYVVHEQNSVMGMANTYLSKHASRVALTYEEAGNSVADQSKIVITGNPVRKSIYGASRGAGRAYCDVPENAIMLVVFGGSLGARHINTALCAAKNSLLALPNVFVYHITGPKEYESVTQALALSPAEALRWKLISYEDNMGDVLAAADVVVSRAGATSLAEISARQIPALLVPYPYATADHQSANAATYVERGAAFLVPDAEVEGPDLLDKLLCLLSSAELRESMRAAAASFETLDAASKLAEVCLEVLGS